MLLNGEDGSNYDAEELGLFKSVLSAAKKVGGTAASIATAPIRKVTIPAAQAAFSVVSKAPTVALAAVNPFAAAQVLVAKKFTGAPAPIAAGQVVEQAAPACGFFQKISRFFGGRPDCT